MGCSKVVYNGKVLIDLTEDTVGRNVLKYGVSCHDASGNPITGNFLGPDYENIKYIDMLKMENRPVVENVKEKNKVVYGDTILVDLTGDTLVDPSDIVYGYTAHDKTGRKIVGTFLGGYPDTFTCEFPLRDSNGEVITDQNGSEILGTVVYHKRDTDNETVVLYVRDDIYE